ncbi:MAG TPA: SDR family oxidoreductase [Puia sp.]|uniref:SDR family NAD(P)-dependent oxidoreductase n=1 Tax=Puia sp. TaxID=2045100 RepID=UPI002BC212B2|nr:SDR family oxidoreductase [Puia sp.]HVU94873.1 SDR family oxidoreductase [Puia sp.]
MRKILIVGASSGIGQALAGQLDEEGVAVISLSRTSPAVNVAQHIAYDIRSVNEPPPFEEALDGLVYCPGSILLKPFRHLKIGDYREDLEINFLGAVRILQRFQSALARSGNASVVLFSSVAVGVGMPYHSSIAASKGAVEGFVKAMAAEWAPAIRVNAIAPSLVKTRLSARLIDTEAKLLLAGQRHPLRRVGEPEDIAAMAAFLLSDKASWITGRVIGVDGGIGSIRQ